MWSNLFTLAIQIFFSFLLSPCEVVRVLLFWFSEREDKKRAEREKVQDSPFTVENTDGCCMRLFVFIRLNRIKSLIHIWIYSIKSQYKQSERLCHLLLFFYSKLFYVNLYVCWTCECECVHGFASVYIILSSITHVLDHFVRKML